MTAEPMGSGASRRTLLKRASVAAAVPTVASLLGGFPGTAAAGDAPGLPDYAPIPAASVGPAMNADGYFVGQVKGNLYWVTDTVSGTSMPPMPMMGSPIIAAMLDGPISAMRSSSSRMRKPAGSRPS